MTASTALRPGRVPVGCLAQVGLEDRLQDELGRRLDHTISDRGDTQWPLTTSWLGYQHPPYGLGPIRLPLQLALQLLEPALLAVRFNLFEGLSVHSCGALLLLRLPERLRQDIPSMDLVVQRVEPELRLRLGLRVQLRSELFELCRGC